MSKKPFHVGRPNLGNKELLMQALSNVIDRKWLTNDGPLLQDLEARLAQRLDVKHCVTMCSGTLALELAIRALGLKGEVILPSFTFISSAHALQWHGIRPVFCDIDPESLCIDPKCVEPLVSDKTTAIMGVHIYGQACDTTALERIASKHDLRLIYDAAHAVGCSHNGRMIGGFGNCEVFSFHATKVLNTMEGGAITTNDEVLAKHLRRMRNFGFPGDGRENTIELGTNAKMNEFCAAMGLTNLASLDDFIAVNKVNYEAYKSALTGIPGIRLYAFDQDESNNYQYVIALIDEDKFGSNRDMLLEALTGQGVLARRYFSPGCHAMEPYISLYPGTADGLPVTEAVGRQVLALPTGKQLGRSEINEICHFIREFCLLGSSVQNERMNHGGALNSANS